MHLHELKLNYRESNSGKCSYVKINYVQNFCEPILKIQPDIRENLFNNLILNVVMYHIAFYTIFLII